MKSDNTLLIVSIIAVVVAAFALIFSIGVIQNVAVMLAPTAPGDVNVNIASNVDIEVTPATINWGDGVVSATTSTQNPANPNPLIVGAYLTTLGAGSVVGDDPLVNAFTPQGSEFVLRNRGNVNINLSMRSDKNIDQWIGGSVPGGARNSSFYYNVTSELGGGPALHACPNGNRPVTFSSWIIPKNTTLPDLGTNICSKMLAPPSADELYFDVLLFIDKNNPPTAGSQQMTLTFSASQSFL